MIIKENIMNRLVKIILILLICGSLIACAAILIGGGTADGYWFGDNYKVQKK